MDHYFEAGGRSYGPGRVLAIAEIGTAHEGDPAKAAELIAAAAESGADCAKFQCVFAEEILHPLTGEVPLPGGSIRLYDRFSSLERGASFYADLKAEVERRGMLFLCTPFGPKSADLLREIGVVALKVASPELNHLPLLERMACFGLPTLLSSGVSTLSDIERAVAAFRGAGHSAGPRGLALLHCVTAYPAPEEDYNLRVLSPLSTLLGLAVGVSDHSADPVLVPALSVAAGGSIVEKHLCLSRAEAGLDDPIALPPCDFAAMVRALRSAQASAPELTLAQLRSAYGADRVEAVLGSGVKRLAPSEAANYRRTNRSIHALRRILTGEVLDAGNLAVLRTEKLLRPGLDPALLPVAEGRRAARDIPAGEGIEWEDLGERAADCPHSSRTTVFP